MKVWLLKKDRTKINWLRISGSFRLMVDFILCPQNKLLRFIFASEFQLKKKWMREDLKFTKVYEKEIFLVKTFFYQFSAKLFYLCFKLTSQKDHPICWKKPIALRDFFNFRLMDLVGINRMTRYAHVERDKLLTKGLQESSWKWGIFLQLKMNKPWKRQISKLSNMSHFF